MIGSSWLVLAGGCLPPATLDPPPTAAAERPAEPEPPPKLCRVLIGEVEGSGYITRELRWGPTGIDEATRDGLVVGDAETLFALTVERRPWDPSELYGEAPLRCEQDLLMLRELPDGLAKPRVAARPACVGVADGESIELESSLRIVSVLGPLLGWRERVAGRAPEPTSQLDYRTMDVRDARELDANVWLLEQSPSMARSRTHGTPCEDDDVPETTAEIDGFAVRWADPGGPRLLVGYPCCKGRSCELDDPLPKVDPELAALLPDPDRLLHSPHGCGSLGLDGRLRTRDGTLVGRVELDVERVIGVVFLPGDHPFEIDW